MMTLNAANVLTLSRLVLTPFFIAFFITDYKAWAFVIFCFAAFTDLIDGTVARLFCKPSKSGALMDPIADKILVQSCFILLLVEGAIPWWFFVMALIRDLMIVSGTTYLECKQVKLPYGAIWASKFATVFQLIVAILGILLWWAPWSQSVQAKLAYWQSISIGVAVALIVISGFQYVRIGLGILRESRSSSDATK